jgi:CRISPR/Cas system CSM-associated protein Csm3 (group 7 of RAMP superfamily)
MRYRAILGKLVARTAIHIGTGEGSDVTDDLCRRDAGGNHLIPGMAIGGVLRTIATRLAPRLGSPVCRALWSDAELKGLSDDERTQPCSCWTCHLFGSVNPREGDTEETGGRASRLFVAHAKASLPEGRSPRIRDGVGIDRASRTSARAGSVKFDLEVLPKGAQFRFRLELEDANENDERLLAAALAEWQAGRAWLGGRAARGLGAFDLRSVKLVERDLSSADGLMAFLKTDKPWEQVAEDANWSTSQLNEARRQLQGGTACHECVARSFVTVRFDLRIDGLFLTNDTTAAVRGGFDYAPLLDVMNTSGRLTLTGAGLRGVLRSHAERIARTLATFDANDVDAFGAICPACDPLRRPTKLDEKAEDTPLASCDALLKGIAPTDEEVGDKHLCLSCYLFGSTRRGSRLIVEDAGSESPLAEISKVLDFLAIDRFTGGGKEGAKFDAIATWKPTFQVQMHMENPAMWELGWLALVLRDLKDEMLTVGFGAAKGFGRAKVGTFTVNHGFISDDDFAGPIKLACGNAHPSSGLYRVLTWDTRDNAQRNELRKTVQQWVEEFNKKRRDFRRNEAPNVTGLPRLKQDTFFSTPAEKLYGKAVTL